MSGCETNERARTGDVVVAIAAQLDHDDSIFVQPVGWAGRRQQILCLDEKSKPENVKQ